MDILFVQAASEGRPASAAEGEPAAPAGQAPDREPEDAERPPAVHYLCAAAPLARDVAGVGFRVLGPSLPFRGPGGAAGGAGGEEPADAEAEGSEARPPAAGRIGQFQDVTGGCAWAVSLRAGPPEVHPRGSVFHRAGLTETAPPSGTEGVHAPMSVPPADNGAHAAPAGRVPRGGEPAPGEGARAAAAGAHAPGAHAPGTHAPGLAAFGGRGEIAAAIRMIDASRNGTLWRRTWPERATPAPPAAEAGAGTAFAPRAAAAPAALGAHPAGTAAPGPQTAVGTVPARPAAGRALHRAGPVVSEAARPAGAIEAGPATPSSHAPPGNPPEAGAGQGRAGERTERPGRLPAGPGEAAANGPAGQAPPLREPSVAAAAPSTGVQGRWGPPEQASGAAENPPAAALGPPVSEEPAAPAGEPLRNLRLRLEGGPGASPGAGVDVRVVKTGGDVRVVLRTPDPGLSQVLAEAVPDLAAALERRGWQAEGWPGADPGGRPNRAGAEEARERGPAGDSSGETPGRQGERREGEPGRRPGRPAPDWLEEIERGVDGGLKAGPFRRGDHS